jgi:hypothetical protein
MKWTFAWPTPSTDRKPCRPQVLADRDAMHARRAADARQRPPQATERRELLCCLCRSKTLLMAARDYTSVAAVNVSAVVS